jgi:hypothetical protein
MTWRLQVLLSSLSAAACTFFMAFYTPLPTVFDEQLALPISRAVADPGLYPVSDLLVTSGVHGPFFAYQFAAVLYRHQLDVDAWWYAFLIASLFALFIALWWLAEGISGRVEIASVAVALVAASSRFRGTLHWMLMPPSNFVTSTLVFPIIVAALALAARGRRGAGLVLAALAFNLHPNLGLIAASAIGVLMVVDPRGMSWRSRLTWFGVAAVAVFPDVWYILHQERANFFGSAAPAISFADEFRIYSYHAFIEDHWRENYGWFIGQLGLMLFFRRQLSPRAWRFVSVITAWCLVLMLVYFANVYTLNYPALDLTFLTRSASYVKLIAFAAVSAGIFGWIGEVQGRASQIRWGVAALLMVGALHKNLDIGEGLLLIAAGAVLWLADGVHPFWRRLTCAGVVTAGLTEVLGQGWSVLHVARFGATQLDVARLVAIVAAAVFCAVATCHPASAATGADAEPALPPRRASTGPSQIVRAVAACGGVLVVAVALRGHLNELRPARLSVIRSNMRISEPPVSTRAVTDWVAQNTPRGSLVVIPPMDARFAAFRLASGRGVFAAVDDVNQLAYDAGVYGEAHHRLLELGMRVVGRHDFDVSAYDTLDSARVSALVREGASFAVFGRVARAASPLPYRVAFEDSLWTVYDLRPTP